MPWWLVVLAIFFTATLEREVILLLLVALVSAVLGREILLFIQQRRSHATAVAGDATATQQKAFTLRSLAWSAVAFAIAHHGAIRFGWLPDNTDPLTGVLLLAALALVLGARRIGAGVG